MPTTEIIRACNYIPRAPVSTKSVMLAWCFKVVFRLIIGTVVITKSLKLKQKSLTTYINGSDVG